MKPKKIDPFVNGFTGKTASGTAAGARTTGLASRQISKPLGNAAMAGARTGIASRNTGLASKQISTPLNTGSGSYRADTLVKPIRKK